MATPLTRQDMIAITDGAKNKVLEKLITKYDIQNATEAARDRLLNTVNAFHVENQTIMRQLVAQGDQSNRRITAVETQLNSVRQEIRVLTQLINRLYDVHAQQMDDVRSKIISSINASSAY